MVEAEGTVVIRNVKTQFASTLGFGFIALLFAIVFASGPDAANAPSLVLAVVSCVLAIRGHRSGYLRIAPPTIEIRTMFRTRIIKLDEITSIEPILIVQVTPRFVPVLKLKSGETYRMSEFFIQKRTFERSPLENKIMEIVKAVSKEIS